MLMMADLYELRNIPTCAGLLEAPTNVSIDIVGEHSVNVSWSPPLTLDGVSILQYSVNITQGLTVQRNTTDTYLTVEKPCTTTTYQITAWSLAGQGFAAVYAYGEILEIITTSV